MKLLDHYISGDGEKSIVEFLKGNLNYQGIDSKGVNQILDLDKVLVPDYDDIQWSEYRPDQFPNVVFITGSRGCVRKCSFCDVAQIWPKYAYRDPKSIIKEIKELNRKYYRKTFRFTDSLINGSIKNYRSLLQELAEYRKEAPDFGWISQWILRPQKFSDEADYQLLKDSGCLWLEIGLESFSESVRFHMGKKFTNEDIDYCFSMLKKYNINSSLLMIVGYPTETEEDHLMTIEKVKDLYAKGYAYNRETKNGVLHFCFSNTLMLDKSFPLWDRVKNGIKNYKSDLEWEYGENTLPVRVRRLTELNDLIRKLEGGKDLYWQIERKVREQNELIKSSNPHLIKGR